jgi:hypothetical protein
VARTSREGDRVEPAALTAGSVTLQNGACHFQVYRDPADRHLTNLGAATKVTPDHGAADRSHPPSRAGGPGNATPSVSLADMCRGVCCPRSACSPRVGCQQAARSGTPGAGATGAERDRSPIPAQAGWCCPVCRQQCSWALRARRLLSNPAGGARVFVAGGVDRGCAGVVSSGSGAARRGCAV